MKRTLELEDDVAANVESVAQATGLPIDKVFNDAVREGLGKVAGKTPLKPGPFQQKTHKLGWYPGMTWEKIQEMLLEEEAHEYRASESGQ